MISDVLFESVEGLQRYLKDPLYVDMYSGACREAIEAVVVHMNLVRRMLDTSIPEVAEHSATALAPIAAALQPLRLAQEAYERELAVARAVALPLTGTSLRDRLKAGGLLKS